MCKREKKKKRDVEIESKGGFYYWQKSISGFEFGVDSNPRIGLVSEDDADEFGAVGTLS